MLQDGSRLSGQSLFDLVELVIQLDFLGLATSCLGVGGVTSSRLALQRRLERSKCLGDRPLPKMGKPAVPDELSSERASVSVPEQTSGWASSCWIRSCV